MVDQAKDNYASAKTTFHVEELHKLELDGKGATLVLSTKMECVQDKSLCVFPQMFLFFFAPLSLLSVKKKGFSTKVVKTICSSRHFCITHML